jgi:ATP-dependent phosphoenolpyruvate carboxykinase
MQLHGREDPLGTLTAWLRAGDSAVVTGPSGFGKTALAAEAVRATIGTDEASLAASRLARSRTA